MPDVFFSAPRGFGDWWRFAGKRIIATKMARGFSEASPINLVSTYGMGDGMCSLQVSQRENYLAVDYIHNTYRVDAGARFSGRAFRYVPIVLALLRTLDRAAFSRPCAHRARVGRQSLVPNHDAARDESGLQSITALKTNRRIGRLSWASKPRLGRSLRPMTSTGPPKITRAISSRNADWSVPISATHGAATVDSSENIALRARCCRTLYLVISGNAYVYGALSGFFFQ